MSSPPRPSTASARRVFLSPTGQRRTATVPVDDKPILAPEDAASAVADPSRTGLEWQAFVRLGLDDSPAQPAPGPSQPQDVLHPGLTQEAEQFHLEMDELSNAQNEFIDPSASPSSGLAVFKIPRPVAGPSRSNQPAPAAPPALAPDLTNTNPLDRPDGPIASTSTSEPATKAKRERKKKEGHQPRPANAWILYRSAQIQKLRTDEDLARKPQSEVSKLISYMWRDESPEVRKHYEEQAQIKKVEHAAMYPNYVYAPQRKDSRRSASGEESSAPVRTPSGRLSRAGRPAARRGRAFTSDELPAEARIRTPGLESLGQYGEGALGPPLNLGGAQMTPSTSASSSSTAALVSPPRGMIPSGLANVYQLSQPEQAPLSGSVAGSYQAPNAMEAWSEFTNSALHWHPHDHHPSGPTTPQEYWDLQPPMSAPAAVAHFNFDPTFANVLPHSQPPMSATTASTAEWTLLSGQSAPSTAASSVPVHPLSGAGPDGSSPWTEVGSLPSPGFRVEGYASMPSNYDPALLGDVPGAAYPSAGGGEGGELEASALTLDGTAYQTFGGASEYSHPMSSEIDPDVEWENHQQQLQYAQQHDHHQAYAFPPAQPFPPQ